MEFFTTDGIDGTSSERPSIASTSRNELDTSRSSGNAPRVSSLSTPSASRGPSTTIAPQKPPPPVQLPPLYAPFRFGVVEEDLYRGAYPKPRNHRFLLRLRLATVLHLTPDPPADHLRDFLSARNIQSIHLRVERPKEDEPPPLTAQRAAQALQIMADASRLPLYVHCVDGAGVTSVIVMLLRRLQMWRMSCVLSERSRFLGGDGSVEQEEVEFVEGFTGEVDLTECAGGLPRWLWGGRPGFRRHPVMRVKLPPVPGAAPTGDRASISSGPSRPSSRAGPVATWGESGGVDAVPSSIVAGVAGVGAVAGSGGVGSSALSTTSTAEPTIIRPMPSPILTNATLRSVTGGTVVAVGSGATGIPAGGIVAGLQAGAQQMLQQQAVAAGAMSMLSPASDPGQLVVQTGPGLLDPAVRKRVEMQHQQMQMQIQMQQPLRSSSVEPRAIGGGATGGIDLGGAVGTGGEGTGSQIVEGPQAGLAEEPTTVRYHAGRRTEAAEDEMSLTLEALALEM